MPYTENILVNLHVWTFLTYSKSRTNIWNQQTDSVNNFLLLLKLCWHHHLQSTDRLASLRRVELSVSVTKVTSWQPRSLFSAVEGWIWFSPFCFSKTERYNWQFRHHYHQYNGHYYHKKKHIVGYFESPTQGFINLTIHSGSTLCNTVRNEWHQTAYISIYYCWVLHPTLPLIFNVITFCDQQVEQLLTVTIWPKEINPSPSLKLNPLGFYFSKVTFK